MTSPNLDRSVRSNKAIPLLLIDSAGLLPVETASAASDQTAMMMVEETLTLRATTVTGLLKEIPGWQHNGLND